MFWMKLTGLDLHPPCVGEVPSVRRKMFIDAKRKEPPSVRRAMSRWTATKITWHSWRRAQTAHTPYYKSSLTEGRCTTCASGFRTVRTVSRMVEIKNRLGGE